MSGQPDVVVAHAAEAADADEELAPGVTRRQATVLAAHANIVQGGFSTPEREAERAARDLIDGVSPEEFEATVQRCQQEVADRIASDGEKATTGVAAVFQAPAIQRSAADEEALIADNPDLADADPSVIDVAKIRRYRQLREAQDASESEAKAMKEEAAKLEVELVDMFAEAGLQNLNVDGKTIYLHRSTYAQWQAGLDIEEKKRLLREAGAADLITETINAQTIAAYVRELCDDDDAPGLPDVLKEHIELGERFAVRITAGGSRKKSQTRSK